MFGNRAQDGKNNICGTRIAKLRTALPGNVSQRKFADMLCLHGLDVDKNVISRIERGERFVSDWELKMIKEVLRVSYEDLLD